MADADLGPGARPPSLADQVRAETRGRGEGARVETWEDQERPAAGPAGCNCRWFFHVGAGLHHYRHGPNRCLLAFDDHQTHARALDKLKSEASASPREQIDLPNPIFTPAQKLHLHTSASPRESTDFIKGLIGQAPPSGRLFEVELPAGEARFSVTGCGFGFQLDEVTAIALRDAIEHGIRHCQNIHCDGRLGK